jgi:adenylate cyclase
VPGDDAVVFHDEDVESLRRVKGLIDFGLPADSVFDLVRTLTTGVSRIADAVRTVIGESLLRPGDTELDLAHRYTAVAELTAPLTGPALEYAFNHHLRDSIRNDVIDRTALATGRLNTGSEVTVAFADLVGFTRLGEELPPERLGGVVDRLGELAAEVAQRPVQLVKMIGDAAMLVSPEPPALVEAALSLVDAADAEGEDFPQLHAGVALGPVVSRGGDWYGHTVNVASRIAAIARPASVLCEDAVHEAAPEAFRWSFAGERRLKGVKRPVRLWRARRLDPEDEETAT